ncbi:pimeloyl-ACP methyl ester carboxylesterase [Streptosporangium album]|uniref:Pimeloyl-ACP methyl ester carboxylesterase n=1 Tax=Streptosporangium album TaxID=47479 RepID=A0A7W7WE79_9ACTN|nr:alpha/beta fold hydrolase [Streptosporangium album]MBB4943618.1 pimeloyl-ACP methyl ester carboxylesterase [Streptosporangium album]
MNQYEPPADRAVGRRATSTVAVVTIALASLVAGSPAATAAGNTKSEVKWQACPAYSDDVLRARGITDQRMSEFRALMSRTECGTVGVPLDYRKPDGRQITVAVTRLKAADRARRLGSIALNPGGPGGSGYLMPIDTTMRNKAAARLNDRYDLIGFDPRGVGYSTKIDCLPSGPGGGEPGPGPGEGEPGPGPGGGEPGPGPGEGEPPPGPGEGEPGPLTEEAAKLIYDRDVAKNNACGRSDPAFLGQLTTVNVARDLDRVRIALGEKKWNFLGVSWGTRLGVVYRSSFPGKVNRMFLDSVVSPRYSVDDFVVATAAAAERNFSRMSAWIALHHDTYGLGITQKQVRAAVLELRQKYDANPKKFTDLRMAVDGAVVARLAMQDSPEWLQVGKALKELQAATGSIAPPTVKEILDRGSIGMVPGSPEVQNATMRQAVACNEDPSRIGFSAAWAAYQRLLEQNPVTGRASRFFVECAGWPLPVQKMPVHRTGGSLVLSGHRYEAGTPYEWTTQMKSAIGGTVFTVNDDVHGSVLKEQGCAAKLVTYFTTGRIDHGCDGVPAAS